ncbi:MAG: ammonium transporter [Actinomycetia bacterium]|nr:ammonium transporter [Actinomycetes bacterium]
MITTLRVRIKDRERQKAFGAYLGGKMIGLGIVVLGLWAVTWYFSTKAGAAMLGQTAPTTQATDIVNPLNTTWTLVTAFLVFFMQAGFMFLEAGFARTREVSNVMISCIADTCLCALLFWAFGFAFMFGTGNKWIGHHYFFLHGAPHTYGSTGVAFLAFFLFQYAFADTCSTVTTGAMVGRTAFGGDLIYSCAVSGFIYPILGHWVWGPDGWLATMKTPFHDFAGSTVVHSIGGFIALAGAIALGPRLGRKFKRDGGGMPPGHDMAIAAVGGVILWFGWYGFNPGSTLSAMDFEGIGRVATNTTLAASAAGLVAMFFVYPRAHKWDTGISINGFLAGLVAITCPCYWVSPFGAICIGAIAGVVVVLGVDLLEYLRIDDPIGAWPVHGLCGIWGTLSLGLFATGQFGGATSTGPDPSTSFKGLFYGGGFHQLQFQIFGSVIICASTFAIALIIMYALKAVGVLRISAEHELEGLDIVEHGAPSYHPEYAYMGYSPIPSGKSPGVAVPRGADSPTISVGE